MDRIKDVIETLSEGRRQKLMKKHGVQTVLTQANSYKRNGGCSKLISELAAPELRKSLKLLDDRELRVAVHGALAFDSKIEILIPNDKGVGNSVSCGKS